MQGLGFEGLRGLGVHGFSGFEVVVLALRVEGLVSELGVADQCLCPGPYLKDSSMSVGSAWGYFLLKPT